MTKEQARDYLLSFLAFWPYAVGWLAGALVRVTLFVLAALIAGYAAGRGGDE